MRKIFIIVAVVIVMASACEAAFADKTIVPAVKKIIVPDWVRTEALCVGFTSSLCLYQALTGLSEAHRFAKADTYLVSEGNYHTFATAQRGMGVVTGWFGYAVYKHERLSRWEKIRLTVGAGMWGRNFMEGFYKYGRYGNPFDYTEPHNEHALVYFGIKDGKITDLYIGTGPLSGPVVDITFWIVGALLLGSV